MSHHAVPLTDEPDLTIEPWRLRERGLALEDLERTESLFALSNGHIGMRGNLDEGEPFGLPGTYLGGYYESRPLPYAEAGYGYPEDGQTVVNVTNGKIMRLLVDDEPFDVRYGTLLEHERTLDLRAGTLTRVLHWRSPAGREVELRTVRLVSFVQRAIAAIRFEVRALEGETRIVLQSELVANEPGAGGNGDPRASAALSAPLVAEQHESHRERALLVHRTRESEIRLAAGMDHIVDGPQGTVVRNESHDDLARLTVATELQHDERLVVTKMLGYGWSSERSLPAVRDQVDAALSGAVRTGWEGILDEQREYLDAFWDRADVELDGDAELQQAIRFALFHTLQCGARAEHRAIAAKGLTGSGYDGHAFWDTETFVLPVLTYTVPEAAADALRWRQRTIDLAKERAAQLGLAGAAFPWRTIRGQECSGYWPAGTAGFHVNADIADAAIRYVETTGDVEFERETGLELLVETARLWRSLGHHDVEGSFHIDGVTGPDEYGAIADDNVYTNLMAQRNLLGAVDAAARHPREAAALGVDEEEIATWRDAAKSMAVPYDERLQVHQQTAGYTGHAEWDFAGTPKDRYPLLLNYPYFDLYRKQVVKQPDLVLALYKRGDWFSAEQKARDFAYYERLTVRDSSLSACVNAIVAAEVGHLDLAFDYFAEAALMDLDDLNGNTSDGLHIASLAGSWLSAVAGFGGMRDHDGVMRFAPRLPHALSRLAFHVTFQGRCLRVEITHREVEYVLRWGEAVEIHHDGEPLVVERGAPVRRSWTVEPAGPPPEQPPGRAPLRRGGSAR